MQDTNGHAKARVQRGPGVPALMIEGLEKSYGSTVALAGVSLCVEPGTILGLLGPNGAGKTSLVSIVAGLRAPGRGPGGGVRDRRAAHAASRAPADRHRAAGDRRVPLAVRARQLAVLRGPDRPLTHPGCTAHRRGRGRARSHRAARPPRRRNCRAANGGVCTRRSRCCTDPHSCCSTSRRPAPTS